jgi:hypothetical protein
LALRSLLAIAYGTVTAKEIDALPLEVQMFITVRLCISLLLLLPHMLLLLGF